MGQSVSKAFKVNGQPTLDGSKLSLSSRGALKAATSGQYGDDLASKSTASTEDSQPRHRRSREDTIAAIQTANAFFDGAWHHSNPWHLNQHDQDGGRSYDRQKERIATGLVENRTPSKPVPVKGALRRQEPSHEEHLELWREHDDSDAQYLKRLYELRTWDMYCRITEARENGGFGGNRGATTGEDPPAMELEPNLVDPPHPPMDASLNDEMIFSCDVE